MRLVLGSLALALLINLLPWSGWALIIRPDFVLLMLLYWVVHEPQNSGQTWGFALGLVCGRWWERLSLACDAIDVSLYTHS